jgi:RNA polymerase sigma-70 factor (ECF subfamily)
MRRGDPPCILGAERKEEKEVEPSPLSPSFLAHAGPTASRLASDPNLEAALRRLLDAGRAAWPEVALDAAAFLRHVAERLPEQGEALDALASMPAADLYLACACAQGDERAMQLFERDFISQIGVYLGRADTLAGVADEVKQLVRTRLLVADGDHARRIVAYKGRGPLGGWLRVVATRAALEVRQARAPATARAPVSVALGRILDPESAYLRAHHAAELEAALKNALAALTPRVGTVLRLHFLDGVSVEAIARLYTVSERTVQRWIAGAREEILDRVRASLATSLQLTSQQLEELLGLLSSRIDITLQGVLGQKPE